jgi:hypothetical protein
MLWLERKATKLRRRPTLLPDRGPRLRLCADSRDCASHKQASTPCRRSTYLSHDALAFRLASSPISRRSCPPLEHCKNIIANTLHGNASRRYLRKTCSAISFICSTGPTRSSTKKAAFFRTKTRHWTMPLGAFVASQVIASCRASK